MKPNGGSASVPNRIFMESQPNNQEYLKTACGGKLKDPSRYPSAGYRGETIYFCTRACLRVFERDPDPFMAGEIEHPIHEDEGR